MARFFFFKDDSAGERKIFFSEKSLEAEGVFIRHFTNNQLKYEITANKLSLIDPNILRFEDQVEGKSLFSADWLYFKSGVLSVYFSGTPTKELWDMGTVDVEDAKLEDQVVGAYKDSKFYSNLLNVNMPKETIYSNVNSKIVFSSMETRSEQGFSYQGAKSKLYLYGSVKGSVRN